MMITVTIDNQKIEVPAGVTILHAARQLGIHIPTLCFADGYKPSTSCMVCVVRVEGFKSLVPACGMRAAENMVVTTSSDEIQTARKTAVELLLSEHVGDCVGPCMRGCPANMNIPQMVRQIAAGKFEDAIQTVKKDIPFPAVLGRICPAPCEKVCRRAQADGAVSICLLKRFVADVDLQSENPYQPMCQPPNGKKVAIIGAGPCGLSAAYYLKQAGVDCVIFDSHDQPGGSLRYGHIAPHYHSRQHCHSRERMSPRTPIRGGNPASMNGSSYHNFCIEELLPPEVLDKEIDQILRLGIEFRGNIRAGRDVSLDDLKNRYEAVLLAVGELTDGYAQNFGIEIKDNKISVNHPDYPTSTKGIFAAGGCIGSRNLCIRAVADGKEAANAIKFYVSGQKTPLKKEYFHQMGRLDEEEMNVFLKQASDRKRIKPKSQSEGLTSVEAQNESRRCLHCDCRKAQDCRLRDLAADFGARRNVWQSQRKLFEQITGHEQIIFEPGKCIKCGLCIQEAQKAGEQIGLSFEGRGFEMEIVVPLKKTLDEGLQKVSLECVKICPTGALSLVERGLPARA